MHLRDCIFLLPGYELENFPRALPAEQSAEVLAGWVALWHPALLNALKTTPRWHRAARPPSDLTDTLIVTPSISKIELPEDFEANVRATNCLVLEPTPGSWRLFQETMLQATDIAQLDAESNSGQLLERLRADFAALGYAYLQVQLMTRKMRYTSNLDQLLFSEQASSAAQAIFAGDEEKAEAMLQSCFDALGQERDHYYSLDLNLLDVTLLAPTTIGKSLSRQLEEATETSFLASASLLAEMKSQQPQNFQSLIARIDAQTACIVGGLDIERPHPLMTRESFARDLYRGRNAYEQLGLQPPRVFGRMSYGMGPENAADFRRFGFEGALLIAWAGGEYPSGSQMKLSWEASDGTFMSALAGSILDASSPASFLTFGWAVGEALDQQHVPTVIFAHWPDKACEYFQLLLNIARRTPALGKWTRADRYFSDTDQPYHQERLTASAFRFNWLVNSDLPQSLILATKLFHILQSRCRSLQNLSTLAWQLENYRSPLKTKTDIDPTQPGEAPADTPAQDSKLLPMTHWEPQLAKLSELADSMLDTHASAPAKFQQAIEEANALAHSLVARLSSRLGVKMQPADANRPPTGRLVINARSYPNRIRVQSDADQLFAAESWNYATGRVGHDRYTSIDVPSMGFVVAAQTSPKSTAPRAAREPLLADAGGMLANEFLEVQIDRSRGHLRSLHVPARRGNRLSLMVARRDRVDGKTVYSEMVATEFRMLTSSNMCGLVRASGRLELAGKKLAKFEIDYEVWRGSRILEIVIRLSELTAPSDSNPWRSSYVARLAWPSESAIVRAYSGGRRTAWTTGAGIAPTLIEIDETDYRTHLFTGGLAFHRRTEMRFLETILSAGQEDVEHRLGLAVDHPHAVQAAEDFLDQRFALTLTGESPKSSLGWLVTADVKNVIVNLEGPLVDASGKLIGMRLFVIETDGKSTNTRIRFMNEVASAHRVDYLGGVVGKLTAKDDSITIALRANEQCNLDVLWR